MTGHSHFIACHDCDLLNRIPLMTNDCRILCRRCGAILLRKRTHMISRTLPLVLCGLILFLMANVFPFMAIKTGGVEQNTIFISGIFQLFQHKMWGLGSIVVLTTLMAPLLQLLGLGYIFTLITLGRTVPGGKPLLKSIIALQPWSMLDVYMIGILVALIKLLKIGSIIPGIALYSFAGLILVQIVISMLLDHHQLWERLAPS